MLLGPSEREPVGETTRACLSTKGSPKTWCPCWFPLKPNVQQNLPRRKHRPTEAQPQSSPPPVPRCPAQMEVPIKVSAASFASFFRGAVAKRKGLLCPWNSGKTYLFGGGRLPLFRCVLSRNQKKTPVEIQCRGGGSQILEKYKPPDDLSVGPVPTADKRG